MKLFADYRQIHVCAPDSDTRLSRWYPVDGAQVLPVVLLTDPLLAPLMTPDRAALVLRTPRAAQG